MLQAIEIYDGLLKAGADPTHVLSMAQDHRQALYDKLDYLNYHATVDALNELDEYIECVNQMVQRQEVACL